MKKATAANRRAYWKYQSAVIAFHQAGMIARHLQTLTSKDDLFYPLMISLHVLYARSFRHSKSNLRVPEQDIPSKHSHNHKLLMQSRDKIFAHHDKNSKFLDENKEDLCQLIATAQNGKVSCGMQYIFPVDIQLKKIEDLCVALEKMCAKQLSKAAKDCIGKAGVPDGLYKVSTNFEGDAPLFEPHNIFC